MTASVIAASPVPAHVTFLELPRVTPPSEDVLTLSPTLAAVVKLTPAVSLPADTTTLPE
jgi:hypothetical protein